MRSVALLLVLAALAVPVSAAGKRASPTKPSETVLAVEFGKRGDRLVRLDRRTLEPTSRGLPLRGHTTAAYAFSPDGHRLAIAVNRAHGLRIVDHQRMKTVGRVSLPSIYTYALGWFAPHRIVGHGQDGVFAVDPVSGKAVRPPAVASEIQEVRRVGRRLVFLWAKPRWSIGSARLAVVDRSGRARVVPLRRIKAGSQIQGDPESFEPGLAIDRSGRAFVVGGRDEPIAEVNLRTLRVTYHDLPTEAKAVVGRKRKAIWLGGGRLAIWGDDAIRGGAPARIELQPVGLSIADLKQRRFHTVDPEARFVAFTAGTLLGSGWELGLRGYSTAGERRFELFRGETVTTIATFGSRGFVLNLSGDGPKCRVIDVAAGTSLGTTRSIPFILHPDFARW